MIQKNYERVLFVAHREEILKQAAESFKMYVIQMITDSLTEIVNALKSR